MWETPEKLWRRLKLGREEYLQRLITTLVVGGDPPTWNTPCLPTDLGLRFLRLLDDLAHQKDSERVADAPRAFIDEYLLPKLNESAQNGWPDWAVLWADRTWIIELKTESGSHRVEQLPYYLQLATAAHPDARVDLTYITGPLSKPPPALLPRQRYSHLKWEQVLPLIEAVWGTDARPEVAAYVAMVRTVIGNLAILRPTEQRSVVLGQPPDWSSAPSEPEVVRPSSAAVAAPPRESEALTPEHDLGGELLSLARSTAGDGRQRAVGAGNPTNLEQLQDIARARIGDLAPDDPTRFVLPWLWKAGHTDGRALTPEGAEFGYELRFSRYKHMQVRP